jgi:hypothetical protein
MLGRVVKGMVLVGAVALALTLGVGLGPADTELSNIESARGIFTLAVPAFAQEVDANEFPHNEVGICAYVRFDNPIDLSKAKLAYSGIEASEAEYVIGTVELPNLLEDMWPHVYISSDGWVMAYYPKAEPTSRIIQWVGYQRDEITTTTLLDVLVQVCRQIGLSTATFESSVAYCHFQYPSASKLLVAVDTTTGKDTFTYTIPFELNLSEASWSHYADGASSYYGGTWVDIDGSRVNAGGEGTYVYCGTIETQYTAPDIAHEVTCYAARGWVGAALVFLYQ